MSAIETTALSAWMIQEGDRVAHEGTVRKVTGFSRHAKANEDGTKTYRITLDHGAVRLTLTSNEEVQVVLTSTFLKS